MISEKPWRPDALLLCAALLMLSLSVGMTAGHYLPSVLPVLKELDPGFFRFALSTVCFQGSAIVLIGVFLNMHHHTWGDVLGGKLTPMRRALLTGIGVGVVVLPVALFLNGISYQVMTLFKMQPEKQAVVAIVEKAVEPWKQILFAIAAIGLAPFVEEFLFRGILYPFLKQRIQPAAAVAITSVLFGAIHGNVLTFLPLVFLAVVLTWVYEKTDALIAPIVTHAFFNAANFLMLLYQNEIMELLKPLRE